MLVSITRWAAHMADKRISVHAYNKIVKLWILKHGGLKGNKRKWFTISSLCKFEPIPSTLVDSLSVSWKEESFSFTGPNQPQTNEDTDHKPLSTSHDLALTEKPRDPMQLLSAFSRFRWRILIRQRQWQKNGWIPPLQDEVESTPFSSTTPEADDVDFHVIACSSLLQWLLPKDGGKLPAGSRVTWQSNGLDPPTPQHTTGSKGGRLV